MCLQMKPIYSRSIGDRTYVGCVTSIIDGDRDSACDSVCDTDIDFDSLLSSISTFVFVECCLNPHVYQVLIRVINSNCNAVRPSESMNSGSVDMVGVDQKSIRQSSSSEVRNQLTKQELNKSKHQSNQIYTHSHKQ